MAKNTKRVSPRQKMINLMYVVLMAMLAMNVSSDVLNGFTVVGDGLTRSADNATLQNSAIYDHFEQQLAKNPEKVRTWFEKAQNVKQLSDSLYTYAEELKTRMVIMADGKNGNVREIKNRDNLEASTQVMLAPGTGEGHNLFDRINRYREAILQMVTDSMQIQIISDNFNTEVPLKGTTLGKNWEEYNFENMPVAAAVTQLTKLQSDVRYAEGEVLHTLVTNIDASDVRVNELSASSIPTR